MSVFSKVLSDPNDKTIEILMKEFEKDPEAEKKFHECIKNLEKTLFDIIDNAKT